jgi:hypothetical protein
MKNVRSTIDIGPLDYQRQISRDFQQGYYNTAGKHSPRVFVLRTLQ